ncbi:MAG TPA: hypothetical protein DCY88_24275 [Cyanobacteria bacterium UBA11372]|nr:hypothetical protein [Cyanobacteria bacterium UBA11372]
MSLKLPNLLETGFLSRSLAIKPQYCRETRFLWVFLVRNRVAWQISSYKATILPRNPVSLGFAWQISSDQATILPRNPVSVPQSCLSDRSLAIIANKPEKLG